jgi:DNA modification methylase
MTRDHTPGLFAEPAAKTTKRAHSQRANDLNGKEWTRFSMSIWNDIRKTADEARLGHPAMFPGALVDRILRCFTREADKTVLDPFCGSGATLVAAKKLGKSGFGFEVAQEYYDLSVQRLRHTQSRLFSPDDAPEPKIYFCDARRIHDYVQPSSVDICITSPPYWDILGRRRSADGKPIRDYAQGDGDLSKLQDYFGFLDGLASVFHQVNLVLKPGRYCVVVVMDIRKQDRFFPFHADLASRLGQADVGLFLDDIVIWDRGHEYNNLRPLGYPTTFRINKIHEYILIFRKPK